MAEVLKPREMVRRHELPKYIPLGETQLTAHEKNDPDFPKGVRSFGRAVFYFLDEVARYQEILARRREEKLARRAGHQEVAS